MYGMGKFCKYRLLSQKRYEINPQLLYSVHSASEALATMRYINYWCFTYLLYGTLTADQSVSVLMTLSDLEGDTRRAKLFRVISRNYAPAVWPRATKIDTATREGGSFLGVFGTPYWRLHGSIYRVTKFGAVTQVTVLVVTRYCNALL